MTSSHNFLSMIFGIFGKFGIEICERKQNSSICFHRKKKWSKKSKNFWSKKSKFFGQKKSVQKKVDRKKKSSNKISITFFFDRKIFSTKKCSVDIFLPKMFDFVFRSNFFSMKHFRRKKIRSHIPIPIFPKIPKIILRKFVRLPNPTRNPARIYRSHVPAIEH